MRFYFQGFMVDDSLFLVEKNGLALEIEPRIFELLVYFCQHPNIPISRDELIQYVWQQRIVGDAAINRAVSELRKLLENEPSKPQIIKTISKVGYQFNVSPNTQSSSTKEDDTTNRLTPISTLNTEADVENYNTNTNNIPLEINSTNGWKLSGVFTILVFFALIVITFYLFFPKQTIKVIPSKIERPLTSLKGTAYKAVLSRDGNDLLFVHKDKANGNTRIWHKRKGQEPLAITNDDFYYTFAIFGADNEIISSRFNNVQQRKCDIVSINLTTKKITKILDCADRAQTMLAYSLERNTLYFNSRSAVNSPYSVYAYQRSTKRIQQVTFPYQAGNIRGDYMLSLSPTNDRLAVFEYKNNNTSLLKIINLFTNEIESHSHEFDVNLTISWLNNDEIVLSDHSGVITYNVSSKNVQPLLTNSSISYVSANPLTGKMVFDKFILNANIYQYVIGSENVLQSKQAVTYSSFVNYQPQFANSSNKRAYLSTNEGESVIMMQPLQGQAYKAEFAGKINSLANLHFSPDDRLLVASINSQLQLFNEKDKQWKSLIPGRNDIHYVHYSNSKNIIFSSDISGDWQIWRLDLSSGVLSQITQKGGYSAQGNINDGYLYLTKFNYSGLYRLNLNTGQEEVVLADFPITSWNKWQVRNNTIYFNRDKGISALDTTSNTERVILPSIEGTPSAFSVSFDEQYLQHPIIEESSANIWLIETINSIKAQD
ncbi:hypothetical protein NBRC116592_09870 [Colwellia sp. KU-HH00111]|uniref:winged helix-turn-helix domain-containing protein n=1 Tax=Colwellia sp. KU-HH00111 TaxID=3127652 RepID=UPI0031037F01